MGTPPGWYADPTDPALVRWWDGSTWTNRVAPAEQPPPRSQPPVTPPPRPRAESGSTTDRRLAELRAEVEHLTRQRDELLGQVVETREIALLQEVGVYEYSHPLDSSVQFKAALDAIKAKVQSCIRSGQAVSGTKRWAINGSEKEGAKMVADFRKLMLRAYNAEADNLVRTLKPYGLKSAVDRLQKTRATILKLGASMKIEVTDEYHDLRVQELGLTADYLVELAEEKEREREEKARLREEAVARQEYERERAKLEKEKAHYEAAARALMAKGDESAAAEATAKLEEIQHAIDGVTAREANARAGYVYVISNIGSFGEEVVKIGMTRRLDPMDRVRELGDASVPFRFDVHAIIFSEDAVGLETALHQRFADRRVNTVNAHREFFYATPQEVREALVALQGSILTFQDVPEALEWRQGLAARSPQLSPSR